MPKKELILPPAFLDSLEGIPGFDRRDFERIHESGIQVSSVRLNPAKISRPDCELPIRHSISWSSQGFYLSERPSFILDPLFHAGAYYVQEASGMFVEEILKQTINLSLPITALDLCAAPGGKSTLLQSVLSAGSILISNEAIRSRVSALLENMTRWGGVNTIVTQDDPETFAGLPGFFDLMLVDAPCSGSGLFRRQPDAVGEWSPEAVRHCSLRQQRILADALPALKAGGLLIYATCSYSREEDEAILDYLCDTKQLDPLRISLNTETGIVESVSSHANAFGYRFWPHRLEGEGFFIAAFRKKEGTEKENPRRIKRVLEPVSKQEKEWLDHWVKENAALEYRKQGDAYWVMPIDLEKKLAALKEAGIHIRQAGVRIGKKAGNELVPDHALAMSALASKEIVAIPLNRDQSLQYLRKEEVSISGDHRGWAPVQYRGINLGWVKILQNRSNNYYPKEWRILKRPD